MLRILNTKASESQCPAYNVSSHKQVNPSQPQDSFETHCILEFTASHSVVRAPFRAPQASSSWIPFPIWLTSAKNLILPGSTRFHTYIYNIYIIMYLPLSLCFFWNTFILRILNYILHIFFVKINKMPFLQGSEVVSIHNLARLIRFSSRTESAFSLEQQNGEPKRHGRGFCLLKLRGFLCHIIYGYIWYEMGCIHVFVSYCFFSIKSTVYRYIFLFIFTCIYINIQSICTTVIILSQNLGS